MKKTNREDVKTKKSGPARKHFDPADPIEILMDEHERARYYAGQLTKAARAIQNEGFSLHSYVQIGEAIRFIDQDIRRHCEREERYLIPLLARHVSEHVQVLRYEHRELWSAFGQLTRIVKDVADGNIKGSSIVELVQSSQAVAELLTDHIEKENNTLFPLTRESLTPEEYAQLREEISGIH